jgi:hypothetical protein
VIAAPRILFASGWAAGRAGTLGQRADDVEASRKESQERARGALLVRREILPAMRRVVGVKVQRSRSDPVRVGAAKVTEGEAAPAKWMGWENGRRRPVRMLPPFSLAFRTNPVSARLTKGGWDDAPPPCPCSHGREGMDGTPRLLAFLAFEPNLGARRVRAPRNRRVHK